MRSVPFAGFFVACSLFAQNVPAPAESQSLLYQGILYLRNGRYDQAVEVLQSEADSNPQKVAPRLYLGIAMSEQAVDGADNAAKLAISIRAEAELRRAIELDRNNKEALAALGRLSLAQAGLLNANQRPAKLDEAAAWYGRVVAIDPNNRDAYYALGVIGWQRFYGPWMTARKNLGMLPEDPGPLKNKQIKDELKAKYAGIIKDGAKSLEKSLQLDPEFDSAMAYMNILVREEAELSDDQETYRKQIAEADRWVLKALNQLSEKFKEGLAREPLLPEELAASASRGRSLLPAAVANLEKTLSIRPDDESVRSLLLGYYSARSNQDVEARGKRLRQIEWFVEHLPESSLFQVGDLQLRSVDFSPPYGEFASRLDAAWQRQVQRYPADPQVLANAVAFYFGTPGDLPGANENAAEYSKRLRKIDPTDPRWPLMLASHYTEAMAKSISADSAGYGSRVRAELEKSVDAVLLGFTGALVWGSGLKQDGSNRNSVFPDSEVGRAWLTKAHDLEPASSLWSRALSGPAPKSIPDAIGTLVRFYREEDLWQDGVVPTAAFATGTLHISKEDQLKNLVYHPSPSTPTGGTGSKGSVLFDALIGTDGRTRKLRTVKFTSFALEGVAHDYAWHCRYAPTIKNGQPMEVATQIEVNFDDPQAAPASAPPHFRPQIFSMSGVQPPPTPPPPPAPPARDTKSTGSPLGLTLPSVDAPTSQAQTIPPVISPPSISKKVEPNYSEEARKAKFEGTVVLSLVVDEQGLPQNIKVSRSLGLGLDEKAIEAVEQWRFTPGTKDGKPVPVIVTINVNFKLK